MKPLLLIILILVMPCALSGWLLQMASGYTISFIQAFTGSMGLFVLMNCAVALSSKGGTTTNLYMDGKEIADE
jgi:hypothetical protein